MISKDFTIEDIHEIRYKSYEKRKNMTSKEIIEDTKREAEEGKKLIEKLRMERQAEKVGFKG